jgi:hypothetical protein
MDDDECGAVGGIRMDKISSEILRASVLVN